MSFEASRILLAMLDLLIEQVNYLRLGCSIGPQRAKLLRVGAALSQAREELNQ